MKKFLGVIVTAIGAVFLAIAALFIVAAGVALLCAWPVMLVLGALHLSGLTLLPALSFWQTMGVLYLLTVIGGSFKSNAFSK